MALETGSSDGEGISTFAQNVMHVFFIYPACGGSRIRVLGENFKEFDGCYIRQRSATLLEDAAEMGRRNE